MNLTLHHIALSVTSLSAAETFYSLVLEFEVCERQLDDAKNLRAIWYRCGETLLMLEKRGMSAIPQSGLEVVAFGIKRADRDSWKERLLQAGIPISRESPYSLYFEDPDGNRLAFSHYPEK
ncbi:MAG: VOC family protein [Deltaproteobacteria bacterium]|nr:VOC family protein [Deltaproteobacteria bacterium]